MAHDFPTDWQAHLNSLTEIGKIGESTTPNSLRYTQPKLDITVAELDRNIVLS